MEKDTFIISTFAVSIYLKSTQEFSSKNANSI